MHASSGRAVLQGRITRSTRACYTHRGVVRVSCARLRISPPLPPWVHTMILTEITIYPVKSSAGVSLPAITVDRFGPQGDRRWMVVNESGGFLTQRDVSRMAQIGVALEQGGIQLACHGSGFTVPAPVRGRRGMGSGSPRSH